MIADFFLGWIAGIVEWFAGLWPDHTITLPATDGVAMYLDDVNYLLPLGELFSAVFVVLLLGVPFVATTLGFWLAALIRGGSSRA